MELDIWSGDWGLPSIDVGCLQVLAYLRFSGVPVKINATNNPWGSFAGSLPVFRHGKKIKLTKMSDIVQHLQGQNYSADCDLSPKERSDVVAWTADLQKKLEPALIYLMYLDERNYTELIRPWQAKRLPIPANYIVPGRLQREAERNISSIYPAEFEMAEIETALFKNAKLCLTRLAERLGQRDFFFGKRPTSLDAAVFSYLAPLLHIPFPNTSNGNYLKGHIAASDNLMAFVKRCLTSYFPTAKDDTQAKPDPEQDEDFPHKWRDISLSLLFAATAMVSYASLKGIIKIDIKPVQ